MFYGDPPPEKLYTLANASQLPVQWSASWEDTTNPPVEGDWLVVVGDPADEVPPLGIAELTIGFDATDLDVGTYTAVVTLADECTGTELSRAVTLEIKVPFDVTPVDEVVTTGVEGGPFDPTDHVFTMRNQVDGPVDWSVTFEPVEPGEDIDWLELDPSQGSLTALDEEAEVTATITDGANDEQIGLHSVRLRFEQPSTGYVTERILTLDVIELVVEPEEGMTFSGPIGGPFSPASFAYTLHNPGLIEMPWEAAFTDTSDPDPGIDWLDLAPTQGTILDEEGTVEIEMTISPDAVSLDMGVYSGTVVFNSTATGATTERAVTLVVGFEPFVIGMANVPPEDSQPNGPTYLYRIGRFEVSNAEFVRFLNDARVYRDTPRGEYLDHNTEQVVVRLTGDGTLVFDASVREAVDFVDGQYVVLDGKEGLPVVGVSWYGAAKFCNWMTLIQGMGFPDERCYEEGPTADDWTPVASPEQLVEKRGFRLPMDDGSSTASPFNEWYKAAAWNEAEQCSTVYGFGRDEITPADANFRESDDPFEPGSSPVGFFDGVNELTNGGGFTNDTENAYGLYDMTGNVAEWIHDVGDSDDERAIRGGHFNNVDASAMLRNDGRGSLLADSVLAYVGFRVVQVYEPAELIVTQDAVRSEGPAGGLFDPEAFVLHIDNTGGYTVDQLTVVSSAQWLEVDGGPMWQVVPGLGIDVVLRPSEDAALLGVSPAPPGDFALVYGSDEQQDGPDYDYWISRTEVTNGQFAAFLNDARADALSENPDERSQYLYFEIDSGSAYINDEQAGEEGLDPPSSTLIYDPSVGRIQFVDDEYVTEAGFEDHPLVGVTWYGAVKYCNWLTLKQGIPAALRAYNEASSDNLDGWHPAAITTVDWATRDLNDAERLDLVSDFLGYRLPMDDGFDNVDPASDLADAYNEWYKAAAWDDEQSVNHDYGFGRDEPPGLSGADANFQCSGDWFEDTVDCVDGGATPVRFFDGVNTLPAPEVDCATPPPDPIRTAGTDNSYGLYDACGNVAEWTQGFFDQDLSLRATRGGSWRDTSESRRLRNDGRRSQPADLPSDDTGFRAVRGTGRAATVRITDPTLGTTYEHHFIVDVFEPFQLSTLEAIEAEGMYGDVFAGHGRDYTLLNESASQMLWSLSVDKGWVDVIETVSGESSGTIGASEELTIHVETNASADDLGPGIHSAAVTVENSTTGRTQTRDVVLTIEQPISVTLQQGSPEFAGYWGGPFEPLDPCTYELANLVSFDLSYSISVDQSWITIEPADELTGELPAGTSLPFEVVPNDGVTVLDVGEYEAAVSFTFIDEGNGNLSDTVEQSVKLVVNDPIEITQATEDWPSSPNPDPAEEPPQVYTLTNHFSLPIDVFVSVDQDWLNVDPTGLEVVPDQPQEVAVSLNENAQMLFDGEYVAELVFEDVVTGEQQCRPIVLIIEEVLSVAPFTDLTTSGIAGGEVRPASKTYTLINVPGGEPGDIEWEVSVQTPDVDWLLINGASAASGTLGDGQSTVVMIYIDPVQTAALEAGDYAADVGFEVIGGEAVTRTVFLTLVEAQFAVQESVISAAVVQPGGPAYEYAMGTFHTTNAEFAAFLNDAMANLTNGRGQYMFFDADTGAVYVNNAQDGQIATGGSGTLMFDPDVGGAVSFDGAAYSVVAGFESHPVVGVSWYGAAKYCNWLTLDQGMLSSERCYTESTVLDLTGWHPKTISQNDWETRDPNDAERADLVAGYRGYRLPMDDGCNNPDVAVDFADAYNERYKAAAWSETLGQNTAYGFGGNTLTGADANFLDSGDPFDNGTTPVDFYSGNGFGVFDMTGNVYEWMQGRFNTDPASIDYRTIRGGSWNDPVTALSLRTDSRTFTIPSLTNDQIGLRVMRTLPDPTDVDQDGDVDYQDFAGATVCLAGPGGELIPGCGAYDLDDDADVDLGDVALFQNAFTGPVD
jgi:formylglycine-generating enzyme required for sulfatase activity